MAEKNEATAQKDTPQEIAQEIIERLPKWCRTILEYQQELEEKQKLISEKPKKINSPEHY